MTRIPGFTSTGSKRPEALFGIGSEPLDPTVPARLGRSQGCRVWDIAGREYLDFIMALGAVALGYAHPAVTRAAVAAIESGGVGPLAPELEGRLAERLCALLPNVERVRFLKTGAEAVAAAVRLARVRTRRDRVLGCGYHGWHDWCQTGSEGVPAATRALYGEIPFNDVERTREIIRAAGGQLACVVAEPVVVLEPTAEWLRTVREETERVGALFVLDEIKTACRIAIGGGAERYGIRADLIVIGKAFANGYPLAAVGGPREVMEAATRTWISSTLSTEWVALAAAEATLGVMVSERVPARLHELGTMLLRGFERARDAFPHLIRGVGGIPEMCFLQFASEDVSRSVAVGCARRGVLLKRSAYNFVSLAHDAAAVRRGLDALEETLREVEVPTGC